MFGYIRPHLPELKVKEAELYRSIYCGLCRTMGETTGQISRLTLSYDMVFLARIRLAITGEQPAFCTFRCGVHPLKRRVAMQPCDALRFSATASGLLVLRKWEDDLRDERGLRHFCKRMLSPLLSRIRRKSAELGDVVTAVDAALDQLHALEAAGCTSPDACADQFGDLLAAIVSDGFSGTDTRIAREIGRHTGRFIYLLDAADDLEKDKREGAYNPFACSNTPVLQSTALQNALRLELCALEQAISLIEIRDAGIEALIKNILYLGMPNCADQILGFLPKKKQSRGLPEVEAKSTLLPTEKERNLPDTQAEKERTK